jgi:N-acetylglucosaminyl-diphospho-decaprenol L-rhamnosyltransferase
VDDLTVILVNYRTDDHTVACLDHLAGLEGEAPSQTVVVDNSPSGRLAIDAERRGSGVVYLPQSDNVGFAAGVNSGLERATGRFVVLLNPDARPEPGCLAGLAAVLAEMPHAAAGPALVPLTPGQTCPPSALRRDPDLWTALVEYTIVHRVVGRDWLDQSYFLRAEDVSAGPVECATVQGACLAVPRDVVDRIGVFDAARFFLYWEETDFLRRLRAGGGRVLYCPHLRCGHDGGASIDGGSQDPVHFWRGLYSYHRKHHGRLYELMLRALLASGIAGELATLATLDLVRRGRDPVLRRDLEYARVRLREQFRRRRRLESAGGA